MHRERPKGSMGNPVGACWSTDSVEQQAGATRPEASDFIPEWEKTGNNARGWEEGNLKERGSQFWLQYMMAGDPRFELGLPDPESGVLPLD